MFIITHAHSIGKLHPTQWTIAAGVVTAFDQGCYEDAEWLWSCALCKHQFHAANDLNRFELTMLNDVV